MSSRLAVVSLVCTFLGACRRDEACPNPSVLVRAEVGEALPQAPESLRFRWWDEVGTLVKETSAALANPPTAPGATLASVCVALDARTGERRVLVQGLRAGAVVAEGGRSITLAGTGRQQEVVALRPGPAPDADGDGFPDVIDACPESKQAQAPPCFKPAAPDAGTADSRASDPQDAAAPMDAAPPDAAADLATPVDAAADRPGVDAAALDATPSIDAAGGAILFRDDFDDGNADGWTFDSGAWEVREEGGERFLRSTGALGRAVGPAAQWTNVSARVRTRSIQNTAVGIMLRWQNGERYYFLGWEPGVGAFIFRKVPNDTVGLAARKDVSLAAGWNELRAEAIGSRLNLWLNGALVLTADDTQITAGAVGLRVVGSDGRFDDVMIESR